MEFGLWIEERSLFVASKLELDIYKIVQDITENLRFAFLYVLSIHCVPAKLFYYISY